MPAASKVSRASTWRVVSAESFIAADNGNIARQIQSRLRNRVFGRAHQLTAGLQPYVSIGPQQRDNPLRRIL